MKNIFKTSFLIIASLLGVAFSLSAQDESNRKILILNAGDPCAPPPAGTGGIYGGSGNWGGCGNVVAQGVGCTDLSILGSACGSNITIQSGLNANLNMRVGGPSGSLVDLGDTVVGCRTRGVYLKSQGADMDIITTGGGGDIKLHAANGTGGDISIQSDADFVMDTTSCAGSDVDLFVSGTTKTITIGGCNDILQLGAACGTSIRIGCCASNVMIEGAPYPPAPVPGTGGIYSGSGSIPCGVVVTGNACNAMDIRARFTVDPPPGGPVALNATGSAINFSVTCGVINMDASCGVNIFNPCGGMTTQIGQTGETVNLDGNVNLCGNVAVNGVDFDTTLQSLSTGWIGTPPSLSINPCDNTKFDMTSGTLQLVDSSTNPPSVSEVFVPSVTAGTPSFLATNTASFISVGAGGAVTQRQQISTNEQRRDFATVGFVSHPNNVDIDVTEDTPQILRDALSQLHDMLQSDGFVSKSGNTVSGLTGLSLSKSQGTGRGLNVNAAINPKDPHTIDMPAVATMTLFNVLRDASLTTTGESVFFDPTVYDNAGVETTVPSNNNATVSLVYAFPNNQFGFLIGQEVFSNFSDAYDAALAGSISFVVPTDFDQGAVLLAQVVAKKNATNADDGSEVAIVSAVGSGTGVASGSQTSLQNAYNISVIPQILTSASGGALTLQQGSGADTDDVFAIQNGSGTGTFAIQGDGEMTSSKVIIDQSADTGVVPFLEMDHADNDWGFRTGSAGFFQIRDFTNCNTPLTFGPNSGNATMRGDDISLIGTGTCGIAQLESDTTSGLSMGVSTCAAFVTVPSANDFSVSHNSTGHIALGNSTSGSVVVGGVDLVMGNTNFGNGQDIIFHGQGLGVSNTADGGLKFIDGAGVEHFLVRTNNNSDALAFGPFTDSDTQTINFNGGTGNIEWRMELVGADDDIVTGQYDFNDNFKKRDVNFNKSTSGQWLAYVDATDNVTIDSPLTLTSNLQVNYINQKTTSSPIHDFNRDAAIVDTNPMAVFRIGSPTESITGKAFLRVLATEAWDSVSADNGFEIEMKTAINGGSSPTNRFIIQNDGTLVLGNGNGAIYLKSGTLATPPTGLIDGEVWMDTTDSATHPELRISTINN